MVRTLTLLMSIGAFLVAGTAQAEVAGDALCMEKKAKAAGKKAADFMKAFGKNVKKPDDAKLAQSLAKAESRFTKGFTKAEDKGGCVTTGDAAAVEAKVDALVMDVVLTLTNICGDHIRAGVEQCDGTDSTECPGGCLADCTCSCDGCTADCTDYVRPDLPESVCPEVDPDHPETLVACTSGSGHLGTWTVDADGLPAYDFIVDQRCDPAAYAYSPRPRPLRDPIHAIGNGRGVIAMAHASGAVELYTQDRGHKWVNRVDTWRDPETPSFPPQIGGGFSYWVVDGAVGSTRFDDLPAGEATARQSRRFGVGYFETLTHDTGVVIRRRVLAPDADARALVAEVTVENPTATAQDYGLVEFWDPNLHQVAVELLTSDLLGAGITDAIERRRRARAAEFSHQVEWDPATRIATVTTTAKSLPTGIDDRLDPAYVDWFPEPLYLAVLDDGVAPDAVWLSDTELWSGTDRSPPVALAAAGDGAPARALGLDGAEQRAILAVRVPLHVEPGATATRRFAFGMVPGGGTPDADVAALRAGATTVAAETASSWRDRLVWAAFPGLEGAGAVQRELAWAAYAALANVSFDEYRGLRVLGQGGAYRFIHGLDGAMGDLAIFAEALLLLEPAVARETLAYAFATQHGSTSSTPWRYPYATTGVGTFSDVIIYTQRSDAYWFLPAITGKYVGITRDTAFLGSTVPYWPRSAGETGSIVDHFAHGLDYAEDVLGIGARGIVAMGTNDYADGITNLATEPATPTGTSSTYNAGMIVHGFPLAADVVEPLSPALATRMRDIAAAQGAALLAEAWEGQYFLRGFVDSGNPLAPHIFFLEPQVFPILAGLADSAQRDSALDQVVARLEAPIGAISNVEIGEGDPVGGIDEPLVGGVWPVANAWLTAAYARRDPAEAWSSFVRNTLAVHAEEYPELWYGIWSGPDSFNGPDKERPGEADAHLVTALTDYPVLNAHVHTGPLRALTDLVGVEGTADGLRIAPRLPTETFHVRWPRLRVESAPDRIAGEVTTDATAPITLSVALPSGLSVAAMVATEVEGVTAGVAVVDGEVTLTLPAKPGAPVTWAISAGGA